MSEELKQEMDIQPPQVQEPGGDGIGLSEEDLSVLGDLSVLQQQEVDLEGAVASDFLDDPHAAARSALEQELSPTAVSTGSASGQAGGAVKPVEFQPLSPAGSNAGSAISSIDMIMDVPMKITVELGRTRMIVREVLNLQAGSVVELDRMAGEVVDVFINDRLIARGEVVVVDDKFGVRITEMLGGFGKGKGTT